MPVGRAHHQRGPSGPEDVGYIVILSVVFLRHGKHTTAAEGITITVDVASARPGIFKVTAVIGGHHLGLTGRTVGMRLQIGIHRLQPSRSNLHIGIEQQIIVVVGSKTLCRHFVQPCKGHIVALGKTMVFFELQQTHLWEFTFQHLHGVIVRTVVGNDDFAQCAAIFHHAGQELPHHRTSVPIQYHNGYHRFQAFSVFFFKGRFLLGVFPRINIIMQQYYNMKRSKRCGLERFAVSVQFA